MKELIFDIETSPLLGWAWGTWETNILKVEKETELLCFAYKWAGDKTIKVHSLQELTPLQLVKKLHDLFNEADIIVAQNGDQFDIKMANTFFIRQNLTPPSPYKTIDTLKIDRSKFKFYSNKLDNVGTILKIGEKVSTGGIQLWFGCMKGDKESWAKMKRYNKQDVALLEEIYLRVKPWANTASKEYGFKCPDCGSENIQLRGWNINKVFKSQRYQCQDCGKWSSSNKKIRHIEGEYLK